MITVEAVFRYPVKSMLGTRLDAVAVVESGLAGDRGWALVDLETGKVASAKQPRLWRSLLQLTTPQGPDGDSPVVVLPDGSRLPAGDGETDRALSRFLGRPVAMQRAREPGAEIDRAVPEEVLDYGVDAVVDVTLLELSQEAPGSAFVDYAPVHLVTTATLDSIGQTIGRTVHPRVFRPNLVLSTPDLTGYAENAWVGSHLTVGEQVRLQVFLPTPRCAVPTLAHGDHRPDPDILRTLADHNRVPVEGFGILPSAGVYAKVLTPGTIHAGDPVQVVPAG